MNIVLTGSVAFDYLMCFPGYFRDHILADRLEHLSLSFLVESMTVQRGGCAPNIAYTLALLGGRPRVMATVGQDFEDYRHWLEGKGVDTSAVRVIPGVFTASFFCNTDRSNAQIASFYPGAMAFAGQLSFRELEVRPDLVVISPNDPEAMAHYIQECKELKIPYVYDPGQQVVRVDGATLRQGIEGALAVFVNDYEQGLIEKSTGLSTAEMLEKVTFMVVTLGDQGSRVYTRQGEVTVPIVPAGCIEDPTGVGDAFRGGFLTGYSRGWDFELCAQMGALSATYCLEHTGPQGHAFTRSEFVERFRQHFDDHGRLDDLLKEPVEAK